MDATSLPFSHSLSLTPAFTLQPHTPTLLSSVEDMASLCLSSATLTVTHQKRTLSLSLQPCSPILLSSVVDATSLPFSHSLSLTPAFTLQPHTPTLLSSVEDTASLCLSSGTLTITHRKREITPYLSLSLSLFLPPPPLSLSISISLSHSLCHSLSLFFSLFSHAHPIYSLLLCTQPLSVSFSLSLSVLCATNRDMVDRSPIFPVISICYANLNKSYNCCT